MGTIHIRIPVVAGLLIVITGCKNGDRYFQPSTIVDLPIPTSVGPVGPTNQSVSTSSTTGGNRYSIVDTQSIGPILIDQETRKGWRWNASDNAWKELGPLPESR